MALELSVVAFDLCGTRVSVSDARVHFKPDDVHDYAAAIVELLDEPRRTRLGRGPDANGTWSYEDNQVSVHLGYWQLSTIDLSAGADQPLSKHGLIRADTLRAPHPG